MWKEVKRAFDIKMGLSSPKDLCAKCYEELKKWMRENEMR